MLWEPFKVTAPSCTAWQFGNEFPVAHTAFYLLIHTAVGDGAMNKFGNCRQWRRFYNFLCRQRRYECSPDIGSAQWALLDVGNCAMMPVAIVGPVQIHRRLFKENGETHLALKKLTQAWWISFPRWEFISKLPTAVRGGAESLKAILEFLKL